MIMIKSSNNIKFFIIKSKLALVPQLMGVTIFLLTKYGVQFIDLST